MWSHDARPADLLVGEGREGRRERRETGRIGRQRRWRRGRRRRWWWRRGRRGRRAAVHRLGSLALALMLHAHLDDAVGLWDQTIKVLALFAKVRLEARQRLLVGVQVAAVEGHARGEARLDARRRRGPESVWVTRLVLVVVARLRVTIVVAVCALAKVAGPRGRVCHVEAEPNARLVASAAGDRVRVRLDELRDRGKVGALAEFLAAGGRRHRRRRRGRWWRGRRRRWRRRGRRQGWRRADNRI